MLRSWNVVITCSFFLFSVTNAFAYTSDETEDRIYIFESNGEVIAVVGGRRSTAVNLRPNEQVQCSRARGNLGAFFTNKEFYVISTSSGGWRKLPLRSGDSRNRVAVLSPNIAILVDEDRAVGFSAASNRSLRIRLPLYDELVAVKAEKYVATVITSSKAFGFSAGASTCSEVRLGVREDVKDVTITARKVTILTSRRILSFRHGDSSWNENRV